MKISVNVPGAHVLGPNGFFRNASLEYVNSTTAVVSASTIESGPDAIQFTVTWKASEGAGTKKTCPFVITFGPKSGIPADGSSELKLDITVSAIFDAVANQRITFSANSQLSPATLEQIKVKGFALSNAIELQPGEYELQFQVSDRLTGRSGVLKVPLKVF